MTCVGLMTMVNIRSRPVTSSAEGGASLVSAPRVLPGWSVLWTGAGAGRDGAPLGASAGKGLVFSLVVEGASGTFCEPLCCADASQTSPNAIATTAAHLFHIVVIK